MLSFHAFTAFTHAIMPRSAIAVTCGLSSLVGYVGFGGLSPFFVAATTLIAAGAMLTMIVDRWGRWRYSKSNSF